MQWIDNAKQSSVKHVFVAYESPAKKAASSARVTSVTEAEPLPVDMASSNDVIVRCCDVILQHGFEIIFDLSLGCQGCPFVYVGRHIGCTQTKTRQSRPDAACDETLSGIQLFRTLDSCVARDLDRRDENHGSDAIKRKQQWNGHIDQSLKYAMRAYAAHWLPVVSQTCGFSAARVQYFIRDNWRACRRDMLKVINRPSYRSIPALYLFA
jgi:hypothetical protein